MTKVAAVRISDHAVCRSPHTEERFEP